MFDELPFWLKCEYFELCCIAFVCWGVFRAMHSLWKRCPGGKHLTVGYAEDAVIKDLQQRMAARLQDRMVSGTSFGRMPSAECVPWLVGASRLENQYFRSKRARKQLRTLNCHGQTETAGVIGTLQLRCVAATGRPRCFRS